LIRWRYADPKRGDDAWTWTPGSRRVRRLDEAILSSSTGTQTNDPDHYSGFNPKTEFYNYKFLGEKQMLMCVHAKHTPEVTCPYDGGASACPEDWELRHVYIVNATPRKIAHAAYGALARNTMVYLDSEVWFENMVDTYDQQGRLWQAHIYYITYRDRPVPDARVAIYPFKRSFVVGAQSVDEQGGIATMCYLPGKKTPERECWYINMGAVDKDFCSVKAMVAAAP
jgi:Protein of unknown function (DUF1329)